mmetsp:Transcript_8974/g.19085  ORF Transcript_8974/g.19085 Transcript_8974/m.19085 type:complete len:308 (+) Transcript_8974:121-1044(+)
MRKPNSFSTFALFYLTNLYSSQPFASSFNFSIPRRLSAAHTISNKNILYQIREVVNYFPSNKQLKMGNANNENGTSIATNTEATMMITNPMKKLGLPTPLILGSGSFTRKLILREMGIDFQLMVRPIDEQSLGDRSGQPSDLVLTLAKAKAAHLIDGILEKELSELRLPEREEGWIVLTGDQVVTHNNSILEKPYDIDQAKQYVEGYATSAPRTVGSCVLTHIPSMTQVSGVDTATINFKPSVSECRLIDRLLEQGAPVLSCAGGLMVEHPFVKEHIQEIDGTEDSVMGLSKRLVEELLVELKDKLC